MVDAEKLKVVSIHILEVVGKFLAYFSLCFVILGLDEWFWMLALGFSALWLGVLSNWLFLQRPPLTPPKKVLKPLGVTILLVATILIQPSVGQGHVALYLGYGGLTLLFGDKMTDCLDEIKGKRMPLSFPESLVFFLMLVPNSMLLFFSGVEVLALALLIAGTFLWFAMGLMFLLHEIFKGPANDNEFGLERNELPTQNAFGNDDDFL